MTDLDLLLKKLAFIETCLTELRTLSKPDELEVNVKERRFVEHTLQLCLQAVQDVASHIVADERLGEPSTNQQLFRLLEGAGWIDAKLADSLRAAIGFRNVDRFTVLSRWMRESSGPRARAAWDLDKRGP